MRTVVYLGLVMIGEALRELACMDAMSDNVIKFMAIIALIAMCMDTSEFIKKMLK